jgi:hypothetical protein
MGLLCRGTQAGPTTILGPPGLSACGRKQGRGGRGYQAAAPADSSDPRLRGGSGTTARVTQLGGGPIWAVGKRGAH